MQYVLRCDTGFYVRDDRVTRPNYAAFETTSRDRCTVAPNIAAAREIRDACAAYMHEYRKSGLAPSPCKIALIAVRP